MPDSPTQPTPTPRQPTLRMWVGIPALAFQPFARELRAALDAKDVDRLMSLIGPFDSLEAMLSELASEAEKWAAGVRQVQGRIAEGLNALRNGQEWRN